jgi:hypothetical protein
MLGFLFDGYGTQTRNTIKTNMPDYTAETILGGLDVDASALQADVGAITKKLDMLVAQKNKVQAQIDAGNYVSAEELKQLTRACAAGIAVFAIRLAAITKRLSNKT